MQSLILTKPIILYESILACFDQRLTVLPWFGLDAGAARGESRGGSFL